MLEVLGAGLKSSRGGLRPEPRWPAGRWLLVHTVAGRGRWGEALVEPGWIALIGLDVRRVQVALPPEPWEFQWLRLASPADRLPPDGFVEIGQRLFTARIDQAFTSQRLAAALAGITSDVTLSEATRLHAETSAHSDAMASAARRDVLHRLIHGALGQVFLLIEHDRHALRRLDPRVIDVLQSITENPSARVSVQSLAHGVQLSPSRLAHLFTAELGMPPMRAVRALRARHAANRLEMTDDTIERIADETGFGSRSELYRQFMQTFGRGPAAYRRAASGRGGPAGR